MRAVEEAVEIDGEKLTHFKSLIRGVARCRGRAAALAAVAAMGVGAVSAPAALASVTSLSQGQGIALSSNPITSTGTISLALPESLTFSTSGNIFSLDNTSTANGSGGLVAEGQSRGVAGYAATGEGVDGQGTLGNALGVLAVGGGSAAGISAAGGSSNGIGGTFQGGGVSGAGIEAVGAPGSGGKGGGDAIEAFGGPGALAGNFFGNVGVSGKLSAAQLSVPLSWTTLSLLNGWSGGPFGTGTPAVSLDGQGIVHFRGAMAESGSSFSATAFVLPAQFRPAHTVFIPVDTVDATTGRLEIETNGTVLVQDTASGGNAKTFTSLDGATYSL